MHRQPRWWRYGGATVLVLAAGAAHHALTGELAGYPFLFAPAILLAAGLFGSGSGIYAALLSTALAAWLFLEPSGSFRIASPGDIGAAALFLVLMLANVVVIERMHTALASLASSNHRLKRAHRQASAAAREKAVLLSELVHRVGNDLAMLASVIELQRHAATDPAVRSALAAAAERVRVLGQLHARLGWRDPQVVLDSRVFLDELCDDLHTTMVGLRPVALEVRAESHALMRARAVPLALIVSELVTNALKYGFPNEGAGTVTVRFARDGAAFQLVVADDGVGMAALSRGGGLGHQLVRALARRLGGGFEAGHGATGLVCRVRFPADVQ
jgi:two-component sensor histidine kinase